MRSAIASALLAGIACTASVPDASPSAATGTPTALASPTAAARPSPTSALTAGLPLFDAHIHYSQPAWSILTPDEALARLSLAGVRRAIVSSSPDEGTQRLYERAPDVVVPFLRPYRGDIGPGTWARDGTTVAYLQSTYRRGVHRGIGELHLAAGETELPVVSAVIDLAIRERLWLQVHTDARGIEEVMTRVGGRTRVLWAHAGQSASPADVRRIVERHPQMWVELAGRYDIASGGAIDEGWRALFLAHPERFMVGSDTWINPQWEQLPDIHARTQAWLAQLPREVATRIASGNAESLFPPLP